VSNLVFKALDVLNHLTPKYDLEFLKENHKKNLHLHAVGKSAKRMADELKDLGLKFKSEIIIGPHEGHPIPNTDSLKAASKLMKAASKLGEKDLVLFCLSGGASSLMELPIEGIGLEELQRIYGDLLLSGKKIHEINAERKKLSQVKGGKLGALYLPAKVHCFVESDVQGNNIEVIGSSPIFSKELPHTYEIILERSHLAKVSKKIFKGFHIEEINEDIEVSVKKHLSLLATHEKLVSYGESSVRVSKSGKGGRNMHWVALMGLELLKKNINFEILSLGSDGIDGPTDAAGAFLDGRIPKKELQDAIDSFNTYELFKKYDLLIQIGPTGYNLNDLRVIELKKPAPISS
jgi:glycerate 2-kinase